MIVAKLRSTCSSAVVSESRRPQILTGTGNRSLKLASRIHVRDETLPEAANDPTENGVNRAKKYPKTGEIRRFRSSVGSDSILLVNVSSPPPDGQLSVNILALSSPLSGPPLCSGQNNPNFYSLP